MLYRIARAITFLGSVFTILVGLASGAFWLYWGLLDWDALQRANQHFTHLIRSGAGLRDLYAADAAQNAHRLNVATESVCIMLSIVLVVMGGIWLSTWLTAFPRNRDLTANQPHDYTTRSNTTPPVRRI